MLTHVISEWSYAISRVGVGEYVCNYEQAFQVCSVHSLINSNQLLFSLSMKEQVINSLHPVGKCNPACYPPSVIQIPLAPPRGIWTYVRQFFDCMRPPAASPMCSLPLLFFLFLIVSENWRQLVIT